MLDQAVDWILGSVRDTLNLVWKLLASTLFHLPDVTVLPQVQALTARALLVVNTTYGLAIIATALVIMAHGTVQIRYAAEELVPRLAIGLAAANFGTVICVSGINMTNTLVMALTGQGIASTHALDQLLRLIIQQMTDPIAALLAAVIGLILVVLVVLLMTGWITRFIALILLCGLAPVALACHGTPWSEWLARLWWQAMGGIGLTVILQAVTLNTSLSIFLSPGANLSSLGLPYDPRGLLNLIIVAVLLAVTVRIPALVRSHLTQTGGRQNVFRALVRLVIVQQVTRALGQAVRGAAHAPRGVHRSGSRYVSGRTTGGPLRGFTTEPARAPIEQQTIAHSRPRQRPGSPSGGSAQRRPGPGQHRAGATGTAPAARPRPSIADGVNPRTVFRPRSPHLNPGAGPGPAGRPTPPRRTPPPDRRNP